MFVEVIHLQAMAASPSAGAVASLSQPSRMHHRVSPAFSWRLGLTCVSPRMHGLLCLNLVCILCASAFTVLRAVESTADAWIFSALRFTIAGLAMMPWWRRALADERVVHAGVDVGFWAAAGKTDMVTLLQL